jgi:hypothetical protein
VVSSRELAGSGEYAHSGADVAGSVAALANTDRCRRFCLGAHGLGGVRVMRRVQPRAAAHSASAITCSAEKHERDRVRHAPTQRKCKETHARDAHSITSVHERVAQANTMEVGHSDGVRDVTLWTTFASHDGLPTQTARLDTLGACAHRA